MEGNRKTLFIALLHVRRHHSPRRETNSVRTSTCPRSHFDRNIMQMRWKLKDLFLFLYIHYSLRLALRLLNYFGAFTCFYRLQIVHYTSFTLRYSYSAEFEMKINSIYYIFSDVRTAPHYYYCLYILLLLLF